MEIDDEVDDFYESNNDTGLSDGIYESYMSDKDSMLILGQPIDEMLTTRNNNSFDIGDRQNKFLKFGSVSNNLDEPDDEAYDYDSFESNHSQDIKFDRGDDNNNNTVNDFSSITFGTASHMDSVEFSGKLLPKRKKKLKSRNKAKSNDNNGGNDDSNPNTSANQDEHNNHNNNRNSHSNSNCNVNKPPCARTSSGDSATHANNLQSADSRYRKVRHRMSTPIMAKNAAPIGSAVAPTIKFNSATLEKQLNSALKQLQHYRRENEVLHVKLDESKFIETISKFRYEIIERNDRIEQLNNENLALREIARNQTKQLIDNEHNKGEETLDNSTDKQLEVLLQHIKILNNKLIDSKQNERKLQETNDEHKQRNSKLHRQLQKLKRQYDALKLQHLQEQQDGDTTTTTTNNPAPTDAVTEPTNNNNDNTTTKAATPKPLEEKLRQTIKQRDKTIQQQQDRFSRELEVLQGDLVKSMRDYDKMQLELQKRDKQRREQDAQMQTLQQQLATLTQEHHQLKQAHNTLLATNTTKPNNNNNNNNNTEPKPPASLRPTSGSSFRSTITTSTKNTAKGGLLASEDEIGGNTTFLTSEHIV